MAALYPRPEGRGLTAVDDKKIKDFQDEFGLFNQKVVAAKADIWLENRDAIAQEQMKFNIAMENLLKNPKIHPETRQLLKTYSNVMNNTIQARAIYHEKEYKKPGKLNDFQALYIETQQLLGNNVEFFCKSAEDRTGRVDDRVMERQVFKTLKGYAPRTEGDYAVMNTSIAPIVHQYSPSQDNTEQNSGARGEQVSGKANPEQARLFNTDREHSQLAKKVFKTSKKLEGPSDDAKMVMKT